MIKLIGFDLDGTLFTDDKRITDETRNTLAEAYERGVFIVPVTGRPFAAVPEIVRNLPGVRYMITASGAVVYDLKEETMLFHDVIANDLMVEILGVLREAGKACMVFIDGVGYAQHEDIRRAIENAPDEATRKYLRSNRTGVDDLMTFTRESGKGVEKFTVNLPYDENGDLIGLEEALELLRPYEDRLHEVYGGNIALEVGNIDSNKGRALEWLSRYLGVKKEETIAFGDSGNDLDMAGSVGMFVAVANATDAIKAAADLITLSNEEDGVAHTIRELVLES